MKPLTRGGSQVPQLYCIPKERMGDWGEQCNAMSQIDPQLAKGLGQIQELLSEDNLELLFLINLSNSRETA